VKNLGGLNSEMLRFAQNDNNKSLIDLWYHPSLAGRQELTRSLSRGFGPASYPRRPGGPGGGEGNALSRHQGRQDFFAAAALVPPTPAPDGQWPLPPGI
jgi:hypothetical protein